jgi:hypothetical protein
MFSQLSLADNTMDNDIGAPTIAATSALREAAVHRARSSTLVSGGATEMPTASGVGSSANRAGSSASSGRAPGDTPPQGTHALKSCTRRRSSATASCATSHAGPSVPGCFRHCCAHGISVGLQKSSPGYACLNLAISACGRTRQRVHLTGDAAGWHPRATGPWPRIPLEGGLCKGAEIAAGAGRLLLGRCRLCSRLLLLL